MVRLSNKNARLLTWRLLIWGGRWGSNPRQQESQSCALPTELRPPYCIYLRQSCQMARPAGLEPATIRLEGGCSIQLSYGRLSICKSRFKAFGCSRNLATPAFAVLPSDWLCSTSGANVIEASITRQQGKIKKFSYIKELRENSRTRLCPGVSPCENAPPFSILSNG